MSARKCIPTIILAVALFATHYMIFAAATGQISGRITDKETGDPIIGASVQIVGTTFGAMTDFDGKFVIRQLEPNTYTVKISHLDYTTFEVTDVKVDSDMVSDIKVEMVKRTSELDEKIVVRGTQDIIDKFAVANEQTISKEVIESKPVTRVSDLLANTQALTAAPSVRRMGKCMVAPSGYPPAHGGNAIVNNKPFDAMFFENYGTNPFVDTEDDHLSTFAIDVDDASYVLARSYLDRGALPEKDAVRTEEFINHFDYGYDAPDDRAFSIFIDGAPSRFGQNCSLMRIGIKGQVIRPENRKPANLIFVVDVSGSMGREDRLGLVRKALRLLIDELDERDKVGIVVYGSYGQEILQPTGLENKDAIVRAIEKLYPSGSTNAEEGIRLGYRMAEGVFEKGKINRVILCSDGVANVGRTGPDQILDMIKNHADKGITLTSLGFGMGNYNDVLLEKLGNKGNGHYAYIDNLGEAKRIFVENLTGTLQVIARDVKIQVDFDTNTVRSYRLLGYENRDVDDDKFRDDKEDGGEIGSGHEVTALYEVKFKDNVEASEFGKVYVRFKDPDSEEVTEINRTIKASLFTSRFDDTSPDFKLAATAAEFAEILRKSYWAKGSKLADVMELAKEVSNQNESGDVIEFMGLINKAQQFEEQLSMR